MGFVCRVLYRRHFFVFGDDVAVERGHKVRRIREARPRRKNKYNKSLQKAKQGASELRQDKKTCICPVMGTFAIHSSRIDSF